MDLCSPLRRDREMGWRSGGRKHRGGHRSHHQRACSAASELRGRRARAPGSSGQGTKEVQRHRVPQRAALCDWPSALGQGLLPRGNFCPGWRASLRSHGSQALDIQGPVWVSVPSGLPGPAGRLLPFGKSVCPRAATRSTFRSFCAYLQMLGPPRTSSI